VAEPSRLWLGHVQRQDPAATLTSAHEGAAFQPPREGTRPTARDKPLAPSEGLTDPHTHCGFWAESFRLSRGRKRGRTVPALVPVNLEAASSRLPSMGARRDAAATLLPGAPRCVILAAA